MDLIKLEDIEKTVEPWDHPAALDEELQTLNQAINEAVTTMNQSVEAVRRLIIVRDALASNTVAE